MIANALQAIAQALAPLPEAHRALALLIALGGLHRPKDNRSMILDRSRETNETIAAYWGAGATDKQLARMFGTSETVIRVRRRQLGLVPGGSPAITVHPKPIPTEEADRPTAA